METRGPWGSRPGRERGPGSHSAVSSLLVCDIPNSTSVQGKTPYCLQTPLSGPVLGSPRPRTLLAGNSVICKGLGAPAGDWTSPQ